MVEAHLHVAPALAEALVDRGVVERPPGAALVFQTAHHDDWDNAQEELITLFRLSKAAATEERSVVYVIELDALLGRLGGIPAMTANGVVSAARTLSLELKKSGARANTIVTTDQVSAGTLGDWVLSLLGDERDGPSGEVIHLGGTQVGKALS
jgi:hypothetical protein